VSLVRDAVTLLLIMAAIRFALSLVAGRVPAVGRFSAYL